MDHRWQRAARPLRQPQNRSRPPCRPAAERPIPPRASPATGGGATEAGVGVAGARTGAAWLDPCGDPDRDPRWQSGELRHDAVLQAEEVVERAVDLRGPHDRAGRHVDEPPGDPDHPAEPLVGAADDIPRAQAAADLQRHRLATAPGGLGRGFREPRA